MIYEDDCIVYKFLKDEVDVKINYRVYWNVDMSVGEKFVRGVYGMVDRGVSAEVVSGDGERVE